MYRRGTIPIIVAVALLVGACMGAWAFNPKSPPPEIDIHPGSNPNPINLNSRGVVPVAILGSDTFDVYEVDPESVRFAGASPVRWAYEDVLLSPYYPDGPIPDPPTDGDIDLVLFFNVQELTIPEGASEACLTAYDENGDLVVDACDSIKVLGASSSSDDESPGQGRGRNRN